MTIIERIRDLLGRESLKRWTFHNLENSSLFSPPRKMTRAEALEYLAGRGNYEYFVVDSVDDADGIIRYRVDYMIYRQCVPSHWTAICVGQSTGEFKIPNVTRQEAIDAVTKDKRHALWYVDDRAAIVFYKLA